MRALKCEGGLTRGRGITDSTLSKWIDAVPHCVPMCNSLETFCSISSCKSEQHVEMRDSRQKTDLKHLTKFLEWFEEHPPLQDRPPGQLVSLSTGLIADDSVNCDNALEVGKKCMALMIGHNFADVKLKRSLRVKPLASMSSVVKINEEDVVMDTMQLLNRIICIQDQIETPVSEYLVYELAPRPLSMFDADSLRKTPKCALEKVMQKMSPTTPSPSSPPTRFVLQY